MRIDTRLLVALVLLAPPSAAAAQLDSRAAWVYADPVGAPLLALTTPTLTAGLCYELQTDALSPASDSVMTIRSGSGVSAVTYAGADDCATPGATYDLRRSCVRFCPVETRPYTVVVRAWQADTAGTAWVVAQQVSAGGTPGTSTCGAPGDPIQSGCWTVLSFSASFGGLPVIVPGPMVAAQFETAESPGAQAAAVPSAHMILFAGDNNDLAANWNLGTNPFTTRNGNVGTHRSLIAGTAQFTAVVPGNPSWNYYTAIAAPASASSAGPFRFIRNDYVRSGSTVFSGTDGDGDWLGPALEDFLRTCDNATTPTYGGIPCNTLPGCGSGPPSATCLQSWRDSDSDGYRDEIEMYGVQLYSGAAEILGGELARYGASPSRYDMFIEVDYEGVAGASVCAASPFSRTEISRAAQLFRSTTSAHFPNRDGTAGIWPHFDIGGRSASPPLPTDIDGGDWGGSGCYDVFPPCTVNADCLGAGGTCCLTPGGCEVPEVGHVDMNRCAMFDHRAHRVHPARRWLFRSEYRFPATSGGTADLCGVYTLAPTLTTLVHETGHAGCLNHEGPNVTRMGPAGHERVNYISRMNYAYQEVGFGMLTGPNWNLVSYSDGHTPDLLPMAVSEECPVSTADGLLINTWSSHAGRVDLTGACPRVDWNLDGTYSPAGTTVEARLGGGTARIWREEERPVEYWSESGPDFAVAGTRLYRFRVGTTAASGLSPRLQYASRSSYSCAEAPAAGTGPRYPSCLILDNTETVLNEGGASFYPVAVAADTTFYSGSALAVVVWRTVSGQLRVGHLSGTTWTLGPVIPGTPTLPALTTGQGYLALARLGGSNNVLLTYRNAAGDLLEQVGTYTGSWTWTAPSVVIAATSTLIASPALTTTESTPVAPNGVLMLVGRQPTSGPPAQEIWTRTTAGVWALGTSGSHASAGIWGRPTIAIRPYRVGATTRHRVWVSWRRAIDLAAYVVQGPNDALVGTWTFPDQFVSFRDGIIAHAFGPDAIYDTRTTSGPRGLRGSWGEFERCPVAPATCPTGTTCMRLAGGTAPLGLEACMTPEGLFRADERRSPGMDGVMPMIAEDFDDWRMLRHAHCALIRNEGMLYGPAAWREDSSSCVGIPDYGL